MRYVEVGGVRVSAIGLGTWQFGSPEWGYGAGFAGHEAGAIVRRALDLGVNLFDTAESYGFGRSERILGAAIGDRRDEAFLATKLLPVAPLPRVIGWRGRASAGRLGVSRIDLYQLHWPNRLVPLRAQAGGLARLLEDGLVGHVGVSNYTRARWEELERVLGYPVLSNQVELSLARRRALGDVVPYAQANDRLVIAYSPLAQGLLAGRYDAANRPRNSVRRANTLFAPENLGRARALLETVRAVAAAHGATPAQVALAWLTRRPNVVAIPGARSVAQLEENAAAADLDLTVEEDARLTAAAERFQPVGRIAALRAGSRIRRPSPA